MIVLGIDTAGRAGGVALVGAPGDPARDLGEPGRHAERIVPAVLELLAETGLSWDGVEGLAVDVGPGSFTGTRVGIAAAVGLAEARGLRATGVGCLDILAGACYHANALAVGSYMISAADVRRGEVVAAAFRIDASGVRRETADGLRAVSDPGEAPPAGTWIAGDGAPLLWPDRDDLARYVPDGAARARAAARLGARALAAGRGEPLAARYAREADARPRRR